MGGGYPHRRLYPYIQHLPTARSRALLTGACRRFAHATGAIREGFHTVVTDAALTDCLGAIDLSSTLPSMSEAWESVSAVRQDTVPDQMALYHDLPWDFDPLSRLREEGDFG